MTTIDEQNRRLARRASRIEIDTNVILLASESKAIQDEIREEMRDREENPRFNRRGVFNHMAAMADLRKKRPDLFATEQHGPTPV